MKQKLCQKNLVKEGKKYLNPNHDENSNVIEKSYWTKCFSRHFILETWM